jgi:ferric-dicitrate binding protein FerR (iron transport regulator)
MIQIPEHILLLIEKQLKGQPSDAETAALRQWRSEQPSHEAVYRQLEKIWQESGAILQEPMYNAEDAWDKIDGRLGHGKSNNTIRMFTRIAMAACLMGLLFFAGWMFFHKKEPTLQLASAGAENKPLTLPDGSQVVLRKGATLSYPETFSGREREVSLTGEAYFDVQHDAAHPFRIQTTRATLEVLGTSFTINNAAGQDELVVSTGKVLFTNKANTGDKHIIVPHQYSKLNDKGFDIRPLDNPNFLSWKTGMLVFDNTSIDQVAAALADHYNVFIKPDSLLMKQRVVPTITAKFNRQPIDSVLEEIKLLANISHRKQNDTIFLFKP